MVPQAESFDDEYFQVPPGFNMVFLPFAEEIRDLDKVLPNHKTRITRN